MKCEKVAGNPASNRTEVMLITPEQALEILGSEQYDELAILATEHGVAIAGPIPGQDPYLAIRFTRE